MLFDGFEDGAGTFCFADFKTCREWGKPLIGRYDRDESFIYQLANDEVSEDDRLLVTDELFKKGRLDADQAWDALRGHAIQRAGAFG